MTETNRNGIICFKIASFLAIATLIIWLCSCNGGGNGRPETIQSDTIYTILLWIDRNGQQSGKGGRVTRDSLMFTDVDSLTMKKKWTKHIQYFVPAYDSIRDGKGKVKPDSTLFNKFLGFIPINSSLVIRDMNISLDSLQKHNSTLIQLDSLKRKK